MAQFRSLLFLLACAALLPGQTALPVLSDEQADSRDEVTIRAGLESHIAVEDIYASKEIQQFAARQADEMIAASQRRVARAERRLNEAQAHLEGGRDPNGTLRPLFDELEGRIQIGYDVLNRANILKDIVQAAQREARRNQGKGPAVTRYDGNGKFSESDLQVVESAYKARFRRPLPVSADGQTSLHRALGFNHAGRVDVALSPDQAEGVWLCKYLRTLRIPFYAFRRAVPGAATAAHIHIGPGSTRLSSSASSRSGARTSSD